MNDDYAVPASEADNLCYVCRNIQAGQCWCYLVEEVAPSLVDPFAEIEAALTHYHKPQDGPSFAGSGPEYPLFLRWRVENGRVENVCKQGHPYAKQPCH